MGQYISLEKIIARTIGKVQYTESDADQNKMPKALAEELLREGECQVELDLSQRYESPFQGTGGEAFSTLPTSTKYVIQTLCELQGVIKILETSFGKGSINNAEKYSESLQKRYDKMIKQLTEYRKEYGSGWKTPPLKGLKLMWGNAEADSGFTGEVLVSSPGGNSGSYPSRQINDPAKGFFYPDNDNWWDTF